MMDSGGVGTMKNDFREYVESKLPRVDDKELFRDLWEAYYRGGPDEVKATIEDLIRSLSGA